MKRYTLGRKLFFLFSITSLTLGCSSDDDISEPLGPTPTGNEIVYDLASVAVPSIMGTATVIENDDNSVTVDLDIQNTPAGGMHPAHIHFNTAAESGDIAISLATVDGTTGESSITFSAQDDGTPITYEQLLDFDGYINVHLSAEELGTIVAQGDIGQNELIGESKVYDLNSVAVEGIDGIATFEKRKNGEALATLNINNTPEDGTHPAHIHLNTAVEGGDIAFSFNPVDGATGISKTNVAALDNDTAFGYDDVLDFDGYINVHLSAEELGTIVAQGDIGQNELTGESKQYILNSVAVPGIEGTATFEERVNGEALATLDISNTPENGTHPAHIHFNTAVEGGDIAFSFNPVNGATGISKTNVATLDDDTAFGYDEVLDFNGYINVHLSSEELGTIVSQGDIGQNELTGEATTYALATKDVPGISGTATFEERNNGTTLITLDLEGTPAGGEHPAHIHENDAATGGDIIVSLNSVDGATGMSKTQISALDDATEITYSELLEINGYINVHLSAAQLSVIVAQGDVGSNVE